MKRTCYICNIEKDLETNFYTHGKTQKRSSRCKQCHKNIVGVRAKKRKQSVFNALVKKIGSDRCPICLGQAIYIDHNHETNQIRGVLCNQCNLAIGSLKTPENLKRAIAYLEANQELGVYHKWNGGHVY